MSENLNQNIQHQEQEAANISESKSQQKLQTYDKIQVNNAETNNNPNDQPEEKNETINQAKSAAAETSEGKKQIEQTQRRENDRNGEINGMTQKEFKQMKKIVRQYPLLKEQFDKLMKIYQIVKNQKEQLKGMLENAQNSTLQLGKAVQTSKNESEFLKGQNSNLKQQVERRKRQTESAQKKLEELKKKIEQAEGMAEKVKQLSMIIDITTKQVEQHKRIEEKLKADQDKYKQLLKCEKELFNNAKVELDKLRQSEKETFTMKQQLVRISTEYKNLKAEKEQLPIMIDKFEHQEQMISELKQKIQQYQRKAQQAKALNEKLQKRVNALIEEKKDAQKKYGKIRCELEESIGQNDALKADLQEERTQFEVQKRRYLGQIKTLKVQLHNEHEKLKITEWQLSESKKREKPAIKLEGVNVMKLSKEDLLNILEEMEMKNQSLKINLDHVAEVIHQKDKKIKDQQSSIMALTRELTKSYPNYHESEGMQYVEKDIIEIGKSKRSDWGEIVEKVMIENLRLKYSVTALGEQFNQQIRTNKEK